MPKLPEPIQRDTRGILDPERLHQRVRLTRYAATGALAGLVDWFWTVAWALPDGVEHRQLVLTHPCANLVVGTANADDGPATPWPLPIEARCYGVTRRLSERRLVGHGWAVAAKTTPGGLGALTARPVAELTDRVEPLTAVIGGDDPALIARIEAVGEEPDRVAVLASALETALARVDPARIAAARQVAEVSRRAETDRSVRRLDELCDRSGVAPRTLQRLFGELAGVSPTWVVRRYRLLDAAAAVRDGRSMVWADVAAELGYADQAHLTRDFKAAIGQTPTAYAAAIRTGQGSSPAARL